MSGLRRIAAAGGGGVVGAGLGMAGLLAVQARLARRVIGSTSGTPPTADGRYVPAAGASHGPEVSLLVIGDSAAAGLGATGPGATPGAVMADAIATELGRPVRLRCAAVVGARTEDLSGQLALASSAATAPDVVVAIVGANDVTARVPPRESARLLGLVVTDLVAQGSAVVVGTCPDLGTVRPIPHPLRLVCRRWSRAMSVAQTQAVARAGGVAVPLGGALGPEFDARPEEMFSADGFHPSDDGYRAAAGVLLMPVLQSLGVAAGRAGLVGDAVLSTALPRRIAGTTDDQRRVTADV